ncbi:hypothetical protein CP532_1161 [Ophiocordyceps camponoti-leonardi (nom. inval.)]|nr:hypothetical protein CP532_1161 [Ophiocordyceps camponoti-leonardi (nom. inval.)]
MPPPEPDPNAAPRKVVTGLPRAQTFKRQQSERRMHLSPITPSLDERRAVSVDRCTNDHEPLDPDASPSALLASSDRIDAAAAVAAADDGSVERRDPNLDDARSVTASQHEAMIDDELESTWILNLSMHFRDRSKREKFFVTYRERLDLWRRVTISLDYRNATPNSLEMNLLNTRYQRDKSVKIYEAIRESLLDIQFFDTVTNLKLETTDGRLHIHVEIINYPLVSQIRHLGCRRIRERDIFFDSHMSGFVYKVRVQGQVLIKKEIPSQDTVEEFLYEVNALNSLRYSRHVVTFYGVVVDDRDDHVKGLLISYASQGSLIDIIYDHVKASNGCRFPWARKEKWARQIIQGLSDIHESGFVQGDFTLSNIVIDDAGDAKIIDINRRGCPVGWEPPEATALLDTGHRISMYIGVKSDLYQLGMVLWGLATEKHEPEVYGRPLPLGPQTDVPGWYWRVTGTCLSADPRTRSQASTLLQLFPKDDVSGQQQQQKQHQHQLYDAISVDDGTSLSEYFVQGFDAEGRPLFSDCPYSGRTYVDTSPVPYEFYYPTRGRSPPSPLPSDLDLCETSRGDGLSKTSWAANRSVRPSYTDIGADDEQEQDQAQDRDREYDRHHDHKHDDEHDNNNEDDNGGNDHDGAASQRQEETPRPTDYQDGERSKAGEAPADPMAAGAQEERALCDGLSAVRESKMESGVTRTTTTDGSQVMAEPSGTTDAVRHGIFREAGDGVDGARRKGSGAVAAADKHDDDDNADDADQGCDLVTGIRSSPSLRGSDAGPGSLYNVVATEGGGPGGNEAEEAGQEKGMGRAGWARSDAEARPRQDGGSSADVQMRLPMSLTGVGAAHMDVDDEAMRGQGMLEDELSAFMRPATVPALMMTRE